MSRKVMIASGKGGTGKSMAAINLACSLAHRGERVILVDLCCGMRTLELYLGLEYKALWDICDVINGTCELATAVLPVEGAWGLFFLPATQKCSYPELDSASFKALLDRLSMMFSYIIMDCPPGAGSLVELASECCDEAILVLTPDYAALRDAEVIEDMLLSHEVMSRRYIVNMVSSELLEKGSGIPIAELDRGLRCSPLGIIPFDNNIRASLAEGVPIVMKRDSYIAENFEKMAERLSKH